MILTYWVASQSKCTPHSGNSSLKKWHFWMEKNNPRPSSKPSMGICNKTRQFALEGRACLGSIFFVHLLEGRLPGLVKSDRKNHEKKWHFCDPIKSTVISIHTVTRSHRLDQSFLCDAHPSFPILPILLLVLSNGELTQISVLNFFLVKSGLLEDSVH